MTPSTDWMADAACKGKYDLFFAPSAGTGVSFDYGPALELCRDCPVADECKAWAIDAGEIDRDGRAVHGVVAGLAPCGKGKLASTAHCGGALRDDGGLPAPQAGTGAGVCVLPARQGRRDHRVQAAEAGVVISLFLPSARTTPLGLSTPDEVVFGPEKNEPGGVTSAPGSGSNPLEVRT